MKKAVKKSPSSQTSQRKEDHLNICRTQNVASEKNAGWDTIELPHRALPEIDWNDISLETTFLGQKLRFPLLISSMTGGSPQGEKVNALLARFAESSGIAMGVGSQRVQLEEKNKNLFSLRKAAPRACLFGNIGAVQLNYGVSIEDCQWLVDTLEAQALILHCNPLQEAIQKEGDRNFSKLLPKISELKKKISVPLILKETGSGIDVKTGKRALEAGIDALDVAGLGGTHWGWIEGLREKSRRTAGELYRNWGIPTVKALNDLRATLGPHIPLIASGGLRSGLDAAKAHYLGADLCGMALPFLQAAVQGEKSLQILLDEFSESLKISLFCTGSLNIERLKAAARD